MGSDVAFLLRGAALGLVVGRPGGRPRGFAGLAAMKPSSSSVSSESKFVGVVAVRVANVAFRIVFFVSAAAVDLVEVRPARLAGDGGITAARAMMILLRVVCFG